MLRLTMIKIEDPQLKKYRYVRVEFVATSPSHHASLCYAVVNGSIYCRHCFASQARGGMFRSDPHLLLSTQGDDSTVAE